VNRMSGQMSSHQTTTLTSPPTHPILLQMLKLAEQNTGQPFTVNWNHQEILLYLEVLVVEQAMKTMTAGRKESGETQMRWVHGEYVKGDFGKQDKKARWTHITRDIELVSELLTDSFEATAQAQGNLKKDGASPTPISNAEMPRRTGRFNALKLTKNAVPSISPSRKNGDVTLSGELNKVELTGILQSISICKMTGRLDLHDTLEGIEVYFDNGVAVHACQMKMLSSDEKPITGDQVLLNALMWNAGSFCFNPERKTSEKSIKRKLEVMLLEGACLKDYSVYLQAANINNNSVLHQKCGALSEEAIKEKLSAGMPMDTRLQKSLYDGFNGVRKLADVVEKEGLQKPVWVPIIFNLLSCNLISADEGEVQSKDADRGEQIIDPAQISKAERDLARYETGFLSFPLLMLFLQGEVDRFIDCGAPVALVIFEILQKQESMSNEKLQKVSSCFRAIAASYELIGHYKDFEFAMLLPLKGESDAREFIEIFQKFVSDCFEDDFGPDSIKMICGLATADSIKAEEFNLQSFVTAAVKAKQVGKQKRSLCTSARQTQWEDLKKRAESVSESAEPDQAIALWNKLYVHSKLLSFDRSYWRQASEKYASLLLAARRYAEVETILSELIRHKTEVVGADDLSTIASAGELAHCYYAQGKYNDAEWLIQGVLAAYAGHYGEEHSVTATWYYNLATLYHVQDNHAMAEPAYKKSLQIRTKVLGDSHIETKKAKEGLESIKRALNPEPVPTPQSAQLITGSWMLYKPDENESVL
jgi:tetratricopeptide (TPR) repeat protein